MSSAAFLLHHTMLIVQAMIKQKLFHWFNCHYGTPSKSIQKPSTPQENVFLIIQRKWDLTNIWCQFNHYQLYSFCSVTELIHVLSVSKDYIVEYTACLKLKWLMKISDNIFLFLNSTNICFGADKENKPIKWYWPLFFIEINLNSHWDTLIIKFYYFLFQVIKSVTQLQKLLLHHYTD